MLHFCCRSSEAGVLEQLPQVYGNQIWQLFSMQNIFSSMPVCSKMCDHVNAVIVPLDEMEEVF